MKRIIAFILGAIVYTITITSLTNKGVKPGQCFSDTNSNGFFAKVTSISIEEGDTTINYVKVKTGFPADIDPYDNMVIQNFKTEFSHKINCEVFEAKRNQAQTDALTTKLDIDLDNLSIRVDDLEEQLRQLKRRKRK